MSYRLLMILILPLFLVSCRTSSLPVPDEVARIQAAVEAAPPMAFEARQSLVFEFTPHWWWPSTRVTALGYAKVDPATGDYSMVCFSPSGVKLFDVERTNGQASSQISIPVAGDPLEAGKIIGEDIGSFYFGLKPPPDATVVQKAGCLVFKSSSSNEWSEYEYDLITTRLVRKTISNNGPLTKITFDEYQRYDFGTYPLVMKLANHKNRYSLTIRNLNIRKAGF